MNTHHHCHLRVVSHSENAMTGGIHGTSRLFSGGWFQKILPVDAKERAVTDRSIALRPEVTWKLRFLACRHRDHRSKTTTADYIPLLLSSFLLLLVFEQKRRDHCCCSLLPGGVPTGQRYPLAQDSLELFHMITILHSTKPQDRLPLTIQHFTKHLFPSWLAARSKQLGRNRQELQQHVPRGGHQSY